ncbi:VOC family protein [Deinococcus sp.]|uniref:VOC family protein n=1 Tax=Deinococcus sp. TaxID=47478 RepID=UPI003CC51697
MNPHLNVLVRHTHDLDVARTYYTQTLGFALEEEHPGALDFGRHGGAELIVLKPRPDQPAFLPPASGVNPWFLVTDVDSYHDRIRAAGAEIVGELQDGPFGRMFTLRTPEGHALTFHRARS